MVTKVSVMVSLFFVVMTAHQSKDFQNAVSFIANHTQYNIGYIVLFSLMAFFKGEK